MSFSSKLRSAVSFSSFKTQCVVHTVVWVLNAWIIGSTFKPVGKIILSNALFLNILKQTKGPRVKLENNQIGQTDYDVTTDSIKQIWSVTIKCQFHQQFTRSLYACRSQMRKRHCWLNCLFCAFGICPRKSCS